MNDSRTTWLREVPDTWRITTINSLYTLRNEKVSDKDYPPLSVTMKGVVPQLESAAKTDDGDNRKLVKVGDFAINSRSDRRGSCGISAYDGSVSLINIVLTPREAMHPGYYNWLFHSSAFSDEFYKWGHGIVDDLWTTRWQEMKRIVVPVPPMEEQTAISEFLDEQCVLIDEAIAEAQTSIEEYKKWKASIISETVSVGLNKSVKTRNRNDSDDVIPVHWKVCRIKDCAWFSPACDCKHMTKDTSVTFAPMECIKNGYFINRESEYGEVSASYTVFQEGDIVIAKVTPCFENGNIAIMEGLHNGFGFGSSELFVLRAHSVIPKFLFYVLQNEKFKQQGCSTMTGTGGLKRVSGEFVKNYIFPIPPEDEQIAIAQYLDDMCDAMRSIIDEKESLISNLESYRRSLIFEVVTGKRKVVQ